MFKLESFSIKERLAAMKCGQRALTLISLSFGLIAFGALALAVATDFWLFTSEPIVKEAEFPDINMTGLNDTYLDMMDLPMYYKLTITAYSGLWRMCIQMEASISSGISIPDCATINYFQQEWERVKEADTTWSILRAIRRSSPVIVFSLLLMIVAFTLSTLGNSKRNLKTISGSVVYIFSALCLGVGVILYISAVNDEVAHWKPPPNSNGAVFEYHYGWAFFFAGGSFITSMLAAVTNITLYLKRYPTIEDMVNIIPGLDKKSNYDFYKVSSEDEPETTVSGSQNPTIIL